MMFTPLQLVEAEGDNCEIPDRGWRCKDAEDDTLRRTWCYVYDLSNFVVRLR